MTHKNRAQGRKHNDRQKVTTRDIVKLVTALFGAVAAIAELIKVLIA